MMKNSLEYTVIGAGQVAAPGAGAVIADTGALSAGTYDLDVILAALDATAAGRGMIIEHRNSANAANIRVLGGCPGPGSENAVICGLQIATGERVRVISGVAADVAGNYNAFIGARLTRKL